jgi:intracellular septation protein
MAMNEQAKLPDEQQSELGRKQRLKMLIEFGPLLVFLAVYWATNTFLADPKQAIFWSTGFLMGATAVSLIASRIFLGRIDTMPLITAGLVAVFGGLTLYLQNDSFIKMKPTILYSLFALALLAGLAMKRFFLKSLFAEVMKLTDDGWRKLTVRWVFFFVALAGLNEFVWRTFSERTWVLFKFPGCLILTMLFAVAQVGLMQRYEQPSE